MGPIFKGQESKTGPWPLNMMPRNCTEGPGMKSSSCFFFYNFARLYTLKTVKDEGCKQRSHTTSSHANQYMWKRQNHLLWASIFARWTECMLARTHFRHKLHPSKAVLSHYHLDKASKFHFIKRQRGDTKHYLLRQRCACNFNFSDK